MSRVRFLRDRFLCNPVYSHTCLLTMTIAAREESIDFSEPLVALLTTRDQHRVMPSVTGDRHLRDSERDPLMRTIIPGLTYPLDDVAFARNSLDSQATSSIHRHSLDLNSIGEAPPQYDASVTAPISMVCRFHRLLKNKAHAHQALCCATAACHCLDVRANARISYRFRAGYGAGWREASSCSSLYSCA